MRIVVAGGSGRVGAELVHVLGDRGHDALVASRSAGVDVVSGEGLDAAVAGADAVIDVLNTAAVNPEDFFATTIGRLLEAEARAGVGHHVLLSIVGIDRVEGNPHYAGKLRQEQLVSAGPVPFSILRATQFHDFAAMVASWTRDGDTVTIPPLLVQPVDVGDVAPALADLATSAPSGRVQELAGPEPQDLVDMTRRTLAARGDARTRIVPSWREGPFGVEMAGEVLLPGPSARRGSTTFADWLATQGA